MKYKLVLFILCLYGALMTVLPAAQAQTVIRDAEIESTLAEWFAPIYKANGMSAEQVDVILVQSNEVNAFVAGGSNIFLYTGLIDLTENPGELIGVMAHELGHISGGHLIRGRQAMEQASYEALLGAILGGAAAVASGDAGGVAAGTMAGSSMAQRRFLSTARSFESSADQAAFRSMQDAGIDPSGLLTFMQKMEGQEALLDSDQNAYVQTHPLTRDRIGALAARVQGAPGAGSGYPPAWQEAHARMKAKILGFINPAQISWQYDDRDTGVPARYARAIAAYRQNDLATALRGIDSLIADEPDNPYFYELKGQMLAEFGRSEESFEPYRRALDLAPGAALIRIAYAQALVAAGGKNPGYYEEAITQLNKAKVKETRSTRLHRLLATAYGSNGREGMAHVHLAEEAMLMGNTAKAADQANRAKTLLPPNDPGAIRANDILLGVQNKA